jgi:D-hydroxyproline dehydrogenase subunit beta
MTNSGAFDLAVVGAGIIGLSCARAAALQGLRVIVIDRDTQANGASVRNFGFVLVAGQERGVGWQRARHTCDIWLDVAREAGIPILQRGMWMTTRRAEALPVFEAFLDTEMGEGCEILSRATALERCPQLVSADTQAVLVSSHGIRVESRDAIPKIAAWLEARCGVTFLRETAVHSIEPSRITTSRGALHARMTVVCPGDDLYALYPKIIATHGITRCKLQMLRLADPGFKLPGAVMSDLGLTRYAGFSNLPQAEALEARLRADQPEYFQHGIHLIAVQSADGTLVVGDSHQYASTPDAFAVERIDELILEEFAAATGRRAPRVIERWTGTYASAAGAAMIVEAPEHNVRLVMITSGTGASSGFAIGEEVIADLLAEL